MKTEKLALISIIASLTIYFIIMVGACALHVIGAIELRSPEAVAVFSFCAILADAVFISFLYIIDE